MGILFAQENKEFIEKALLEAKVRVVICSAYLKESALSWVATLLKNNVENPNVTIVTRWQYQDLAMGASDFSAYELAKKYGWGFCINQNMHFKICMIDKTSVIVGSANFTRRGLHLGLTGNDEACVCLTPSESDIVKLDQYVSCCCDMNDDLYTRMKQYVEEDSSERETQIQQKWPSNISDFIEPFLITLYLKDFPSCSPLSIEDASTEAITHDLDLLGVSSFENNPKSNDILVAFRLSLFWRWLLLSLNESENEYVRFGELSAKLHDALLDDPKPYRAKVKSALSILFEWIRFLNPPEVGIKKFNTTEALFLNKK